SSPARLIAPADTRLNSGESSYHFRSWTRQSSARMAMRRSRTKGLPVAGAKAKWCVYVLRCADGTLYTGVTTDLARRVRQHNAGTASKYTRSRRPVTLAYRETAAGRGAALSREAAIKKLPRAAKELLATAGRSRRGGLPR